MKYIDNMKKICIYFFLFILYIPIILSVLSNVTKWSLDVSLNGYVKTNEKPDFTTESFLSGEYQTKYAQWFNSVLRPRGVLIKTYASINYNLFRLGNRPIGYNNDIFEMPYIEAELCLNEEYDFAYQENREGMRKFVEDLVSVQKKLNSIDKSIYVYIAPSKADFDFDNIPKKYLALSGVNSDRVVDCFRNYISQNNVPYMICADMKNELEYPAFYTTGIHWSRTFEQMASKKIIENLSDVLNKKYRNIFFSGVQSSTIPFWRDADVFDLLNVWNEINNIYYEYNVDREYPEEFDKMRFLIYGDSFGEGLRKDILGNYPYEEIYYINYNNYVLDNRGNVTNLDKSWDNFDFGYYLDHTDVVIIEMSEHLIKDKTLGFVERLNAFLDVYTSGIKEEQYMDELNAGIDTAWNNEFLYGVFPRESDFAWLRPYSKVIICNPEIAERGLEISFNIPQEILEDGVPAEIIVYINGKRVYGNQFKESGAELILVPVEELEKTESNGYTYEIEIICNKSFFPEELGLNGDGKGVGLQLKYIGKVR